MKGYIGGPARSATPCALAATPLHGWIVEHVVGHLCTKQTLGASERDCCRQRQPRRDCFRDEHIPTPGCFFSLHVRRRWQQLGDVYKPDEALRLVLCGVMEAEIAQLVVGVQMLDDAIFDT